MSTMLTSDTFQDAVNYAVRANFDHTRDNILQNIEGRELFKEYEPNFPNEQLQAMDGPGYGTLTIENQQYGSNQLWRDYPKAITLRKYTSELSYTEEDVHWLKKSMKTGNNLGTQMTLSSITRAALTPLVGNINRDVARLFYLSLGTTFFTGGDSKAICASDHPIRKTGGTQSNTGTSAISSSVLASTITSMNRFQGMDGVQLPKVRRFALVGGNEQEPVFQQLLDSMYGPGNALLGLQQSSRAQFSARGVQASYVILPEIPEAYANYWWVVDLDRAMDRFLLCWGWRPRLSRQELPQQGSTAIPASTYFGPYALGWQWIYGSSGTT